MLEEKMNIEQKIAYNENQANKYDWSPEWFDCFYFDAALVNAITTFQTEMGLTADGLCGPATYRKKFTQRAATGDYNAEWIIPEGKKYIVHDGNPIEIHWDKVILWTDEGGLSCKAGSYSDRSGKTPRSVETFILHWDAALSSPSCASILAKRNLSITYCIGNKGEVWQLLDSKHVAWHSGNYNSRSVGVEISNAYYVDKYQSWYVKNGFGPRPIIQGATCHGVKMKPFLGFYPIQLEACAALIEAVSRAMDIPLIVPETKYAVDPDVVNKRFSGVHAHYHCSRNKIDISGVDLSALIQRAKEIREENS